MLGFLVFLLLLFGYCFVGGVTFYKIRATTPRRRNSYDDGDSIVVAGFAGAFWPLGLPVWAGFQLAKKLDK